MKVPIPRQRFLDRESVANVQGLGSIPLVHLEGLVPSRGKLWPTLSGLLYTRSRLTSDPYCAGGVPLRMNSAISLALARAACM